MAGLEIQRVPARRAINSRATRRGPVDELVITNARARRLDVVPVRMLPAIRSKVKSQRSKTA